MDSSFKLKNLNLSFPFCLIKIHGIIRVKKGEKYVRVDACQTPQYDCQVFPWFIAQIATSLISIFPSS